jgi:hypothetical protein
MFPSDKGSAHFVLLQFIGRPSHALDASYIAFLNPLCSLIQRFLGFYLALFITLLLLLGVSVCFLNLY